MAPPSERLKDRLVLITGASRGIGRAVATRFAAEGARLILTARTQGALEELDDELRRAGHAPPTLAPLDLADFSLIDRMAGGIAERFGRLDALIANAGMLGGLSPLHHVEPDTFDRVLALNLTANFRLIRAFDPLLRASDAGRLVFVTSGIARSRRAYWGPYGAGKAALEAMVQIYAAEVAKTRLRVNLLDPGRVRTGMRAEAMPGEDPMTLPAPDEITGAFVDLAAPACTCHGEIVLAGRI